MRVILILILCVFALMLKAQNVSCTSRDSTLLVEGESLEFSGDWAAALLKYQKVNTTSDNLSCLYKASSRIARVHLTIGDFLLEVENDKVLSFDFIKDYNRLDHYALASTFYLKAIQSASKNKDSLGVWFSKYGVGITHYKRNEFEKAINLYSEVIESFTNQLNLRKVSDKNTNYGLYKSWVINAKGAALLKLGELGNDDNLISQSIKSFTRLYEYHLANSSNSDLVGVCLNIGLAYQSLNQLDSSFYFNHQALSIAEKDTSISLFQKSQVWYGLYKNYQSKQKLDSAIYFLELYSESHGDLLSKEQTAAISQFLVLFEAEKQNRKIKSLENALVMSFIILVFSVLLSVYFIQRRKALKKLSDQKINDLLQQQEIRSLQGVLAGQEEERKRIAGDLHDKLGAILGMVKLHFSAVEERIDTLRDDNKQQYEKANTLLDQASEEVRNISHNLISGVLTKFGLIPALNDLKDKIESTGKLRVQLVISDMDERLSGEQELQLYRIVQELIGNVLKHSKATEAEIQLTRINGNLNLLVQDNGIGFDPDAAKNKKGMGMQNLQARVDQLNGTLHYDSGKGAGTTVSIDIPIEA